MKLQKQLAAEIALRTLRPDARHRVSAWFDRLQNWEYDAQVRKNARKLPETDAYVLPTGDDYWIFFRKDADTITVQDIANQRTIDLFAAAE